MSTPAPILTASADWHWSPTPYPGVDFTWLRRNPDGGGSALLKLAKARSCRCTSTRARNRYSSPPADSRWASTC
ncbi:Uncharacterised protein [Chromobacterium violaceum]|uniref:Uncharacterized protein n=1 Tax=Chromobacterium violaceum TaxID=536 RepID=A0A447TC94_CHRVL|nr:Uncharacterised protein [Chromobacterium violaceum]